MNNVYISTDKKRLGENSWGGRLSLVDKRFDIINR